MMLRSFDPHSVLHVVDTLEFGGLERVVADLAVAQRDAGSRVAVFSIQDTRGFRAHLEAAGVPVIVGGKQGSFDRQVLRRLRAAISEHDGGIVHTHNFVPNYYAALASLGTSSAPILINTCHNMGTRLANRRLRWLYRASLLRTRRVAMVSRQVHERFVAAGWVSAGQATTVINGIPTARFARDASRRALARDALALGPQSLVIGCVGRLVPVKHHAALLAQLPALIAACPSLQLVLIGDGPLEAELREQAHALGVLDQVIFAGARPDVAELLPALDVFVMPSLSEGMSIALLEACATGLAIVATKVGGNPQVIDDGRSGLLVEADDGQALFDAVHALIVDPALRAKLGAAATSWVHEHASVEVMRDAYARVYLDARK